MFKVVGIFIAIMAALIVGDLISGGAVTAFLDGFPK